MGLSGVIDAERDLRRGGIFVEADGAFASVSSLLAEPADAPRDVTVWLRGVRILRGRRNV